MSTSPESTPAPEAPKPAALLLEVITKNEIAGPDLIMLQGSFSPMLAEVERWAAIAKGIKITSATQTREMKLARETRLGLRQLRVDADKKRKALKDTALRYGRAVDGAYAIVEFITKETEAHLLEQEKFAERIEEQRIAALKAEREEKLKPYGVDVSLYQLGLMPQEAFDSLLEGQRLAAEAKEKERRRVEQERLEAENKRLIEEQRIRDENERLRREKAERDEADRVERERVAAELAARAQEVKDLAAKRTELLKPYGGYGTFIGLGLVTEEAFQENLATAKRHFEEAQQRQAEAERARLANEAALAAERRKSDELLAAQRAETERVAKEAADREAAVQAERDRVQALSNDRLKEIQQFTFAERPDAIFGAMTQEAWDAAMVTARATHQAEVDRRAQAEKDRLEAQAARDRERQLLADKEIEIQRAAAATDKDKLIAFRDAILAIKLTPESIPSSSAIFALVEEQQKKFGAWIDYKISVI